MWNTYDIVIGGIYMMGNIKIEIDDLYSSFKSNKFNLEISKSPYLAPNKILFHLNELRFFFFFNDLGSLGMN